MTPTELQQWLGAHGQPVAVDGKPGPITRAAIIAAFTNTCAEAVTDADIAALANRLGCTAKQLKAMASVESGGNAFDNQGRPKILFERHLFHRFTGGRYGLTNFSNPKGGGYSESSWDKLTRAACLDADAAFSAVSWGRFQVLGMHWQSLNYPSPIDMAYSTVTSEAGHLDMLGRYIDRNGLRAKLAALSTNPDDNRALARAYNGVRYEDFNYHVKLANAMARP